MSRLGARLHVLNDRREDAARGPVVYWARWNRRPTENLALDHAIHRANALGVPLVVYEALDLRYPYASDRMHAFVLEGVASMAEGVRARGAAYGFFLPRTREEAASRRPVFELASRAALLVTDWMPPLWGREAFWSRTDRTLGRLPVRVECVDDLTPVALAGLQERPETAARTLRPRFHARLASDLIASDEPVATQRIEHFDFPFPSAEPAPVAVDPWLGECEIDHTVPRVTGTVGGPAEAQRRWSRFLAGAGRNYAEERNDPAREGTTSLSAHLHFGQISARAMVRQVQTAGLPAETVAAIVEQLGVRRTLAWQFAATHPAHTTYESVPEWARRTLAAHATDPRPVQSFEAWEEARTTDPLWNAAQHELRTAGRIHNYLRMLWGKVAITMAPTPRHAHAWLVRLNDRWALDGRDANTYAGIGWCFGLHDTPFPERAVYGIVRSMTSKSTARKWDVESYASRVGTSLDPMSLFGHRGTD